MLTAIILSSPSPLQCEYALVVPGVLVAFITLFFRLSPISSTVVEFLSPKSFPRSPIHSLHTTSQNVVLPVFRFLQDFPASFPRSPLSLSLQASYISLRPCYLRLNLSSAQLLPLRILCSVTRPANLILPHSPVSSRHCPTPFKFTPPVPTISVPHTSSVRRLLFTALQSCPFFVLAVVCPVPCESYDVLSSVDLFFYLSLTGQASLTAPLISCLPTV